MKAWESWKIYGYLLCVWSSQIFLNIFLVMYCIIQFYWFVSYWQCCPVFDFPPWNKFYYCRKEVVAISPNTEPFLTPMHSNKGVTLWCHVATFQLFFCNPKVHNVSNFCFFWPPCHSWWAYPQTNWCGKHFGNNSCLEPIPHRDHFKLILWYSFQY